MSVGNSDEQSSVDYETLSSDGPRLPVRDNTMYRWVQLVFTGLALILWSIVVNLDSRCVQGVFDNTEQLSKDEKSRSQTYQQIMWSILGMLTTSVLLNVSSRSLIRRMNDAVEVHDPVCNRNWWYTLFPEYASSAYRERQQIPVPMSYMTVLAVITSVCTGIMAAVNAVEYPGQLAGITAATLAQSSFSLIAASTLSTVLLRARIGMEAALYNISCCC